MTASGARADGCELCALDKGVYDFGRVCCCARFVCSVPIKQLRAGWMEWFKSRNRAEFFEQLECTVKARWATKKNNQGAGSGGG